MQETFPRRVHVLHRSQPARIVRLPSDLDQETPDRVPPTSKSRTMPREGRSRCRFQAKESSQRSDDDSCNLMSSVFFSCHIAGCDNRLGRHAKTMTSITDSL